MDFDYSGTIDFATLINAPLDQNVVRVVENPVGLSRTYSSFLYSLQNLTLMCKNQRWIATLIP